MRITKDKNQDAFSKMSLNTCDNDCGAPSSDLNHDVLSLIMMRLGIVDFHAFSGVCKSWRSFAVFNRNKFMASRLPMSIPTFNNANYHHHSEDLERRFKTILPHYAGRTCVGTTCGYLILFGEKSNDFWPVNPYTRHELQFDAKPILSGDNPDRIRGILVFSPLMSRWVFVMTDGSTNIWFSIAGQGAWNHVSSTSPVVDLHAFKGKMYTINIAGHLCELRLNPEPKLMLLEMKNVLYLSIHQQFFSWGENLLYVMRLFRVYYEFHFLDFDKMKWMACERASDAWRLTHRKCKWFFGNSYHLCLKDYFINE